MAYIRGGVGGGGPDSISPLRILKEMKTSLFGTNCLFYTGIAQIALMFFCAIQLAYEVLKNFYCDAIIDLPVVKLFWCAALHVDDCRKSETFLFRNQGYLEQRDRLLQYRTDNSGAKSHYRSGCFRLV